MQVEIKYMQVEIIQIDMGNSEKNFEGNVREQESNQGIFFQFTFEIKCVEPEVKPRKFSERNTFFSRIVTMKVFSANFYL
jgi:hypothetical protein